MTDVFDGLALGGPLDGKRITHYGPHYRAAEQNKILPFSAFTEVLATSMTSMDIFEYVYVRTPGGNVWIPRDVERGERYEHKIWRDVYDYVFSKLIRGYRPEGY